ncbi:hypothetical protein G3I44_02850 [Halogeometricum borinquense]|uniref:Uncharacterized protein n=1 Tax=Halogeometricum borinquense TaxID=60847 RepID=A0A6C0UD90_9EURY|nr:hypothetical protein [Halogeometricum borinquense]QIB73312.1 hypothetical protein G3I44_02850 [Halogeometricum borinquense]
MKYNYQDYNWDKILSSGTEIRVQEGGRLTANFVHKTPQIINIVDSSDTEIPESDPHLPEEFAGLPASVTIRGVRKGDDEPSEGPLDIIYIIESLQRGDSKVVSK